MVEHDIQDDFDPILMQCPDQFLKLSAFMVALHFRGIARIRCKEADSIIAPVFEQPLAVHFTYIHTLIKLKDRHQLYSIDPQLF